MSPASYSVDFLGCKISQTDAEQIGEALAQAGHRAVADGAAIGVVNACCITAEAERKTRKRVRQLLAAGGDEARVFVTGCGATLHPGAFAAISERVIALPGAAVLSAQRIVAAADELGELGCKGAEPPVGSVERRTRAFVKVQDGCSFDCSYCVVPLVRGDTRSRPLDAVLADVRRRVAQGRREIVLTGINIGLYREPRRRDALPAVLRAVAETEGVVRVRISSIEINHVNKRLVATMAQLPNVCPHLHVPMQSGDDAVLADMGRHYKADGYLRAIDRARGELPELNLTTDVIVGYPTEDDAAFEHTLELAVRAGVTKAHAFPYSPRPGTLTADADPVPAAVKAERSVRLRAAADARARAHWSSRVGSTDELLVEQRRSGAIGGYLRDYSPVTAIDACGRELTCGELVRVELTGATDTGLVVRAV